MIWRKKRPGEVFLCALSQKVFRDVDIVYKHEMDKTKDWAKQRESKVEEFRQKFANPYIACEMGYLDEIIEPKFTRPKLIAALEILENKRDKNPPKKRGNIPL